MRPGSISPLDQHDPVYPTESSSLNTFVEDPGPLTLLAVDPHSIGEGHSA